MSGRELLSFLQSEETINDRVAALYRLDTIDLWLRSGDFQEVDMLFEVLDPTEIPITISIGLLILSFRAKHELENREKYFQELKVHVINAGEDTERLLFGLE